MRRLFCFATNETTPAELARDIAARGRERSRLQSKEPGQPGEIYLTETGGPKRALVLQGLTARHTSGANTRDTGGPWRSTTLGSSKVFHTLIY